MDGSYITSSNDKVQSNQQKRRLSFSEIMKSCQEPRSSELPPLDKMSLEQISQEVARIADPFKKVDPEIVAKSYELGIQLPDDKKIKRPSYEVWIGEKLLHKERTNYTAGWETLSRPEILQQLLESRERNLEKLNRYREQALVLVDQNKDDQNIVQIDKDIRTLMRNIDHHICWTLEQFLNNPASFICQQKKCLHEELTREIREDRLEQAKRKRKLIEQEKQKVQYLLAAFNPPKKEFSSPDPSKIFPPYLKEYYDLQENTTLERQAAIKGPIPPCYLENTCQRPPNMPTSQAWAEYLLKCAGEVEAYYSDQIKRNYSGRGEKGVWRIKRADKKTVGHLFSGKIG